MVVILPMLVVLVLTNPIITISIVLLCEDGGYTMLVVLVLTNPIITTSIVLLCGDDGYTANATGWS